MIESILLGSKILQATDIPLSDSDLSESSEDAPCIDLEDREVQEYAKLKGGQVKKAFNRGDVVKISDDDKTMLKDELCNFFTQSESKDGKTLTWCICSGPKQCVLKIITKNGTWSRSSSLLLHFD